MESWQAYIRDVLGVQSWIRPQVEVQAVGNAVPTLGIVRDLQWSSAESALVEKILQSIQLSDLSEDANSTNIIVFREGAVGCDTFDAQKIWNLGPLSHLMKGSPDQIQNAKREVWNLLKRLKEELRS